MNCDKRNHDSIWYDHHLTLRDKGKYLFVGTKSFRTIVICLLLRDYALA
jgi:hypothetical protein